MALRGRYKLDNYSVFFVTTSTRKHQPLFCNEETLRAVQKILFYSVERHSVELLGYVLMKNHLHLLLHIPTGGKALSNFMRDFKMSVALRLFKGRGSIWQNGFDDVAIYSEKVFNVKLRYIHDNPVRAGYVKNSTEWQFSSASDWLTGKSSDQVKTDLFVE